MPDRDVKTIRDQIYFQYAKLITRATLCFRLSTAQLACAPELQRRSVNYLLSRISFGNPVEFAQSEKECIYCGAKKDLSWEHIVPKSTVINGKCPACPAIQGISNQVWACKSCNSSKNDLGLYAYFKRENQAEKKYFDILPALLEKKYLKTIYKCHECAGDLDRTVEGLSVLNLDFG